ncbi:hypothetical protein DdX_13770 [Ditylenchus destructor]|uniref:Uncharacterized protein n=1 Tax=Ditylenchus destructor TaxID=166010 RepID=A0AAD4R2F6_9BILA|nr:hypothetical protein DdX_13770 [Ditylenchus destructor]
MDFHFAKLRRKAKVLSRKYGNISSANLAIRQTLDTDCGSSARETDSSANQSSSQGQAGREYEKYPNGQIGIENFERYAKLFSRNSAAFAAVIERRWRNKLIKAGWLDCRWPWCLNHISLYTQDQPGDDACGYARRHMDCFIDTKRPQITRYFLGAKSRYKTCTCHTCLDFLSRSTKYMSPGISCNNGFEAKIRDNIPSLCPLDYYESVPPAVLLPTLGRCPSTLLCCVAAASLREWHRANHFRFAGLQSPSEAPKAMPKSHISILSVIRIDAHTSPEGMAAGNVQYPAPGPLSQGHLGRRPGFPARVPAWGISQKH